MLKKSYLNLTVLIASIISLTGYSQSLSDDIDISAGAYGVVPLPASAPTAFHTDGFVNYTKIQCPNGEAIHFVAQDQITLAQIVKTRTILEFYLTDIPGSAYGSDKSGVMNQMGTNDAVLLLVNGSDGSGPEPTVFGQPLYEQEIAVEGHAWYQTNDFDNHRDASFEEILHLMHDMGIGVDGVGGMPGALPAYQLEIRAAQENAEFAIWPLGGDGTDVGITAWYNELSLENSLTQEYLASLIDSYYGLWEPWTEDPTKGMWGIYEPHNRAEIQTEDPMGWNLLPKYFSPYINVDMMIDPSFDGIFSLVNNPSEPYTHKSQYLQHCYLMGTNNSGLRGNDLYNRLKGNNGNNTFEGLKGNDRLDGNGGENSAIFTGVFSEYTVTNLTSYAIVTDGVTDRDGIDTLWNMHHMIFSDQTVGITLESTVAGIDDSESKIELIQVYPNPAENFISISLSNQYNTYRLEVRDVSGQLMFQSEYMNSTDAQIDIIDFSAGLYFLNVYANETNSTIKFIKK